MRSKSCMPCSLEVFNYIEGRKKKVIKGVWRMPWLLEAKKDVISCDKRGGLANTNRSRDFRMGQPGMLKTCHPAMGANPVN
jgi:hypothetical protein